MLTVGSLFSGIGGLDRGLELAGMRVVWQVERHPKRAQVLARHWPAVERYADIAELTGHELTPVDIIIAGGFPCQPVSYAGEQRGQDDPRWLWPHFARLVRILRPSYVLVENVPGLLTRGMDEVLGDLAGCGYDAEWDCIPASALGAWHRRDRLFIVAYPARLGWRQGAGGSQARQSGTRAVRADIADASSIGRQRNARVGTSGRDDARARPTSLAHPDRERQLQQERRIFKVERRPSDSGWWAAEPGVVRMVHGLPGRVDRVEGLGNAVVPQVAEWVGRMIVEDAAA